MTTMVVDVPGTVRVFDLRHSAPSSGGLDALMAVEEPDLGAAVRAVVVDSVDRLVANEGRYRWLSQRMPQGVICVAVGRIHDVRGHLALHRPASLDAVGGTLWIGDDRGIRWTGGDDPGRPVSGATTGLTELLAALVDWSVFDSVLAVLRRLPHQTAAPGLDIVFSSVGEAEARATHQRALRDIMASPAVAGPPLVVSASRTSAGDWSDDRRPAEVATGSTLAVARNRMRSALTGAETAARLLTRPGGRLLGAGAACAGALLEVGQSLGEFADLTTEVLRRLDQRAAGNPHAAEALARLGVVDHQTTEHAGLAADLRSAVISRLKDGESLPSLTIQLRQLANQQAFSAASSGLQRPSASTVADTRTKLTAPPPLTLWPKPLASVAALAFVLTLLSSWASLIAATPVALVWLVLGTLSATRRPGPTPDNARWSVAALCGAVVLGVAGGVVLHSTLPPAGLPAALVLAVTVVLAVGISLGTLLAADRSLARKWLAQVDLGAARRVFDGLVAVLDDALRKHGNGNRDAGRLADAALLLAAGLAEVQDVYAKALTDDAIGDHLPTAASAELFAALRQDLVELAVTALEPSFADIADAAPLAVEQGRCGGLAERRFAAYTAHLAVNPLQQPSVITDGEPRQRLIATLWQHSKHARDLLHADARAELVQLCRPSDLRLVSRDRAVAVLLRFAPTRVQSILSRAPAGDIIAVDANLAGVVRLAPMLPGRVRVVQATVTDPDQEITAGNLLGPTSGVES